SRDLAATRYKSLAGGPFKLPSFWVKNPRVWFLQVEAQFQLRHITSSLTKYFHIVSSLPPEVADEVDDLLAPPPATEPYEQLKTTILDRKTTSERTRLQQLLAAEELGDRRPSQMLHRMRQLLGDQSVDSNSPLLRELFLQRLPQQIVVVLAATDDMNLDKLAQVADRIAGYSTPAPVAAAAAPSAQSSSSVEARQGRLEERLDEIAATLVETRPIDPPHREASHTRSSSRRPRYPSPPKSQDNACWYHRTSASDARRCHEPCFWSEN
ncbi:unnamed protein product, partial [Ixodes hexagonus]